MSKEGAEPSDKKRRGPGIKFAVSDTSPEAVAAREAAYAEGQKKRLARMNQISAAGRDIGDIPRVKNPWRREWALRTTQNFAETYLAMSFTDEVTGERWPWSDRHIEVFRKIDEAITGKQFVEAEPRGGGKTSRIIAGVLRAILGGLHPWVCVIAATGPKSHDIIESLQTIIETNDLLLQDFPEAIYPIRALKRNAAKARQQTCMGRETRIEWHADIIMFPDIKGSDSAGAIITATGLEAAGIRGQRRSMPDGTTRRPTLVLLDDPQTDESGNSLYQTDTRWNLLNGAVLQMGPPSRPMSALAAVTVIRENDLADRMLNSPQWNGVRSPMMISLPVHQSDTPLEVPHADWWDRYADELRDNRIEEADAIYSRHTAAIFRPECIPLLDKQRPCRDCEFRMQCMDADAIVSWRYRKHPADRTAVQHAMNLKILKPEMFAAEMQQRPLSSRIGSARITPAQVCERISGLPMGDVPTEAAYLTAHVDVHKDILYFTVCAWESDFTGQIIQYGTFPDQPVRWFRQADPPRPLAREFPGLDENGTIFAAVDKICEWLLHREFFKRSDRGNTPMLLDKLLVDGRYGTKLIHGVRRKLRTSTMETMLGVGIGPNKKPITMYDRERSEGKKIGDNWYRPLTTGTQEHPHIMADVNYWKTQAQKALAIPMGTRGAMTLFGLPGTAGAHEPFAEHIAGSEYPTEMPPDTYGRVVTVYQPFPHHPDNHWFDCYDAETEVLSKTGWMLFSDLRGNESLATVNLASDQIEYQFPSALIRKPYEGEMVKVGGEKYSRIDLLVTPSHRMVVHAGQGSDKMPPTFKEASSLTIWDKIKCSAHWTGVGVKTFKIPQAFNKKYKDVEIDAVLLAQFLGWYVAEGCCGHYGKKRDARVIISQNRGPKADKIRKLLDLLPWRYHQNDKGFVLSNDQAYRIVCDFGGRSTKRVPQWIKDATPDLISEFVRCAVDGDGWRRKGCETYASISNELAGDIQELYLKMGYATSLRYVFPKPYCIEGRSGENVQPQYWAYRKTVVRAQLRDSRNKPNFRRVNYSGMVYCATVPNGTLIVRRNGKVAVCGNCLVGAYVAASIVGCQWPVDRANKVTVQVVRRPRPMVPSSAYAFDPALG